LLGPLFYYDLLCTSRRTRFIAVRCVYALALLIALFCLYASWFGIGSFGEPLSPNQEAAFATDFFFTFLAVQLTAVLLLTPAYTSAAVAEEREAGRLDFLLTSELSNREIVLGKFFARLGNVGLILLTGLPILGLMQFLGGIDPNLVLAGFAVTLATMLSVGSLGVWVSVSCQRASSALWWTYLGIGLALLTCGCCPGLNYAHPVVAYHHLNSALSDQKNLSDVLPPLVMVYLGSHGILAAVQILAAVALVRPPLERTVPITLPVERPLPPPVPAEHPSPPPVRVAARQPIESWPNRPCVSDHPLHWKELHFGAYRLAPEFRDVFNLLALMPAGLVVIIWGATFIEAIQRDGNVHSHLEFLTQLCLTLGLILAGLSLLCIALRASATVIREREQGTLDALLTLPIDRSEILWAKWLGAILSVRLWIGVLAVIWLLCTLTGGLDQLSGSLLVMAFFAFAGCTASLGLCCSVISTNRRFATLFTLLALFLWNGMPLLLPTEFLPLSPVVGLWEFTVPPSDLPDTSRDSAKFVAWMGVFFSVTTGKILWGLAKHYFEAERGPHPAQ
jgi:ABC-type transport system involved in multi-copper enzyme maturation permease subunit